MTPRPIVEGTGAPEVFVDRRVHECYLLFRGPVLQTDSDVEEAFKSFFRPNFVTMLGDHPESVWDQNKEWLFGRARRLGNLALTIAQKDGHERVTIADVKQAISQLRNDMIKVLGGNSEMSCEVDPTKGGWCAGNN